MTFQQIIHDVTSQKIAPFYFLQGEEPYYIDLLVDFFEKNILNESEKAFDLSIFYGKDMKVEQVIDSAMRMPFIAKKQIIICKEVQSYDKFEEKKNTDFIEKYLQNPSPTSVVIFAYKYKKLDARKSFGKLISSKHILFTSDKIKDDKIPQFITEYVQQNEHKIDTKAANLLAEYLGNDLSKITNEIQKLFINKEKSSTITTHDIETNIGISKDYNVFELQQALSKRDNAKVYTIIHYMNLNSKSNPIQMTIGSLSSYFTKILLYHYNAHADKNTLAQKIGTSPYYLGEYSTAAKNYSLSQTEKIIENIHRCDLKTKGVNNDNHHSEELLRDLIISIVNV